MESSPRYGPSQSPEARSLTEIRRECDRLLDRIMHRPGSVKLLLIAERSLLMLAGYKLGRQTVRDRLHAKKPPAVKPGAISN